MDILQHTYNNFHGIDINDDIPKINFLSYDWIQKFIYTFNNQNLKGWNSSKMKSNNDISSIVQENLFMSEPIKKWIINNSFFKIKYKNNKYGQITLYAHKKEDYKCININDCVRLLQTLYHYSPTKNEVNIVIILTKFKKKLPEIKEQEIDCGNVNTGVSDGKNIMLWRQEEVTKVLIHELIHHYKLDFGYTDKIKNKINITFLKNIKIHNHNQIINIKIDNFSGKQYDKININEAITETLATIINCILYYININNNFTKLLTYEVWHSFIQVSKILNHCGFNSIEEFLELNESNKVLKEKTNVFSYYVIKSLLLYDLPNVIELLNLNNKRTTENYIKLLNKIKIHKKYISAINWLLFQNINDASLTMTVQQ